MEALATGGTFKEISKTQFCTLEIPLPPINVQQEIVAEIEGHQNHIEVLKQKISDQEITIQDTINRVWVSAE